MTRVAFSGVFDIANYGDHLFPFLFEKWMRAAGEVCETELYSVLAGPQAFGTGRQVFALQDLARRHAERPYDALIVSGGALIHHRNILQRLPGREEMVNYPIPHSWVAPSLVGLQTGTPVLWNAPGAPADFLPAEKALTAFLLRGVDFISTRNEASAASLRAVLPQGTPVTVTPDPAFLLPRYYTDEELAGVREALGVGGAYAVFHTHPKLPETMWPDVIDALKALRKEGLRVILLPLAYTHGDEQLAGRLAEMADTEGIIALGGGLSLRQMLAVLAGCGMYIGVSFHGAITAFAYGRKVMALDFFHYRKTEAVYRIMGEESHYHTASDGLKDRALSLLAEPSRDGRRLEALQAQVDAFYQAMLRVLRNPPHRAPEPDAGITYGLMRQALIQPEQYSQAYVESLIRYRDEAQKALDASAQQLEQTQAYAQQMQAYADSLARQREADQQAAAEQQRQTREYIRQAGESASQAQAYIGNLEERCRQLEAYGKTQSACLEEQQREHERYAKDREAVIESLSGQNQRLAEELSEQTRRLTNELAQKDQRMQDMAEEAEKQSTRLRELEKECTALRREADAGPVERIRLRQERRKAEQARMTEQNG